MPEVEYTPNVKTDIPAETYTDITRPKIEPGPDITEKHQETDPDTVPLALYQDPPLVELYKVQDLYDDDIDDLQKKVEYIDSSIKKEILKRDWKPDVKSYKDVLDKWCNKLEIKNESGYGTIDKLYMWLYMNLPSI